MPSQPTTPRPTPTQTLHAQVRCRTGSLRLGFGGRVSEPTEQHTLSLTLTNIGSNPCYVEGYPDVALLDAQGSPIPFAYRRSGDQLVTSNPPHRVDLASGGTAFVTINKNTCIGPSYASARQVSLAPPGEAEMLRQPIPSSVDTGYAYCGKNEVGSDVHVSPLESTFQETTAIR